MGDRCTLILEALRIIPRFRKREGGEENSTNRIRYNIRNIVKKSIKYAYFFNITVGCPVKYLINPYQISSEKSQLQMGL